MIEGRIIKGVGGLYHVRDGAVSYPCRARGLFRLKKITPMVGDWVMFDSPQGDEEGIIGEILPRTSQLKRPAVANVDVNVIVIAAVHPQPDLLLVDRLLAQAQEMGLTAMLCVNKADQADDETLAEITRQYRHLLPHIYVTSTEHDLGYEDLARVLAGRTVCFSGQSGVGKSTLINALADQAQMEVGNISLRTQRGKHTTRHVQLMDMALGGYVVDTPGFSLLEMGLMEPPLLAALYPDFLPYLEECRFAGCLHVSEPGCAVKQAVEQEHIDPMRYERYRLLLEDMKERWKSRYE